MISYLAIPYYRTIFVLICLKHTTTYGTIVDKKVDSDNNGDYYNYTLQYFVSGQEVKVEMLRGFEFKSSKRELGEKVKVIASNRYPKIHYIVDNVGLFEYLFVIILYFIAIVKLIQTYKRTFSPT